MVIKALVITFKDGGLRKINQFKSWIKVRRTEINQYILWFKISMNNLTFMEIGDCGKKLHGYGNKRID